MPSLDCGVNGLEAALPGAAFNGDDFLREDVVVVEELPGTSKRRDVLPLL